MLPHLAHKKPHLRPLYQTKSHTLWTDQCAPESIEQIYSSCLYRLAECTSRIEELDHIYKIDEENLFNTMNVYSFQLSKLRELVGINELKSSKAISDVIKVLKNNIKNYNDEKEFQKETFSIGIQFFVNTIEKLQTELISPKEEKSNAHIKEELDIDFDDTDSQEGKIEESEAVKALNQSIKSLARNKKPQIMPSLKRADSTITPLLASTRRKFIPVNQDTEYELFYLEDILEKTTHALAENYSYLIEEVDNIQNVCEKYLLSFYEKSLGDIFKLYAKDKNEEFNLNENLKKYENYLDTVIKYDKRRVYYINVVDRALRNLRHIRRNFTDLSGVQIKHFSEDSQKLSKRFDLGLLQVCLIIPEHSFVLKKCISLVKEWIEYDKEYSSYVYRDLKIIEKQKKSLALLKYSCESLHNQLVYRIDLIKNDVFEMSMGRKLDSLSEAQVLKRKNFKYSDFDCRTMLERIGLELNQMDNELAKLKRKFSAERFCVLKSNLGDLREEMFILYEEKKVQQVDIDLLENSYFKLKEILMFKNSSEILEKIYYNIQLPNLKFGIPKDLNSSFEINEYDMLLYKQDKFANSILIASQMIGNDWIRLYYKLPFYPERGQENIKKDIDDVFFRFNRGNSEKVFLKRIYLE